jgi:hypothetical protein
VLLTSLKLPTKTTNTAAYLKGEGRSQPTPFSELAIFGSTNAAAEAKHSILLVIAMTVSTTENNTVDAIMKLSLAIGEWMK